VQGVVATKQRESCRSSDLSMTALHVPLQEQYARRVGAILGLAAASALFKVTPSGSSPPRSFQPGLSRTTGESGPSPPGWKELVLKQYVLVSSTDLMHAPRI
jgi:hypothetical protein